jgi:hypothetical protein
MRYQFFSCLLLFVFVACKNTPEKEVAVKGASVVVLPVSPEKIKGMYTGEFRGSPISVVLTQVSDKQATGYDMHMGQHRNLSGVVEFIGNKLHLYLVEPGDSRFDGKLHLEIDTATWKGNGTWKSFISGKEIPFSFRKRSIEKPAQGQVFVNEKANYITLRPNGTCLLNYLDDSAVQSKPVLVAGKYKKDKNKLFINWDKNKVYPSGRSAFNLVAERPVKGDVFLLESLRNEQEVFSEMVFD